MSTAFRLCMFYVYMSQNCYLAFCEDKLATLLRSSARFILQTGVCASHGRRKDYFHGGPVGNFPKIFSRGTKSSEICFLPLEIEKNNFFLLIFSKSKGPPFRRPWRQPVHPHTYARIRRDISAALFCSCKFL